MENLLFALNATVPLFLVMLLGLVFRRMNVFNDEFVGTMNSFVFKIALPACVFYELAIQDFYEMWDFTFVLFCFFVTAICIVLSLIIAKVFFGCSGDITGEFAQASYRSSAAILGIGFIENLYGNAGIAPLMLASAVPLYNVMAVTLLAFFKPGGGSIDRRLMIKTLKSIVTNPIILSIAAGVLWSVLRLPQPAIFMKTVKYISNLSTPMGLMAVGACFDIRKAFGRLVPALSCTMLKLIVWVAIFIPIAVSLGFRQDKLISVLIMLGSPTTVTSFVMAKNMGHDGTLSSSTVMLTTLMSAFTLTGWIYIFRAMGLI